MNDETPKPRWWTRLLHRPGWLAVLAVCLLLAAVLVPFGWRHYRTQQLIAGIESCGGAVEFERGGPTWLRNIVGDEWMKPFDIPNELLCQLPSPISAGGPFHKEGVFDDAGFLTNVVPLNNLYGLKRVALCRHQMTNRSFKALLQFEDLEALLITGKSFDDEALGYLSPASKLRSLSLDRTSVTDKEVLELQRRLPALKVSHH